MLGRSAAVAGAALLVAASIVADVAAASIEVDEEGVMHNRGGLVEARDFDLKKLKAVHSGTHDQADVGSSYRIHYDYDGCANALPASAAPCAQLLTGGAQGADLAVARHPAGRGGLRRGEADVPLPLRDPQGRDRQVRGAQELRPQPGCAGPQEGQAAALQVRPLDRELRRHHADLGGPEQDPPGHRRRRRQRPDRRAAGAPFSSLTGGSGLLSAKPARGRGLRRSATRRASSGR